MKISLSKLFQMHWKGFPIRFMPFSISKYYIYLVGSIYYIINNNEKKNIIGIISNVLQKNIIR
jgi:hypothetical protein